MAELRPGPLETWAPRSGKFVHKADKVAIKPNGIAGKNGATMASNKELVLEIVKGVMAAGVPASSIVIYEQYPKFMAGTRVASRTGVLDASFPAGITSTVHENKDATMPEIQVAGIGTKFAWVLPLHRGDGGDQRGASSRTTPSAGYYGLPQEHHPRLHHQPARLPRAMNASHADRPALRRRTW